MKSARKGRAHDGRREGAFTLVELIVVIAIVAVLTALAIPASSRVIQAGKTSSCFSNLHQLGVALNLYLADHNQVMPMLAAGRKSISENVPVIDNTLTQYVNDPKVFACPADNAGLAAATGTSYYWNSALSGQTMTNLHFMLLSQSTSEIPILSDKQGFHPYESNKVNLLYADGHASADVRFLTSPQ
jgi:prepilin-type N-terminal cleavage/methylation domain-containing protein/prepilin-type processing-associated H-X9-DG protein